MTRYLTLKDKAEMKYMGYTIRAWFTNPNGVPFHKDFTNRTEMESFVEKAHGVGSKLVGFASL